MILGPPVQRLFNSKEYSKEEIDHAWQQQRCICCEGTRAILFIFPGLVVICWYGHTNTYGYYSMELAVVKAQELKWAQRDSILQYPYLDCSSIGMPGIIVLVMNCHQRELYEAIWCFFWDIDKIDECKCRVSHWGHCKSPQIRNSVFGNQAIQFLVHKTVFQGWLFS